MLIHGIPVSEWEARASRWESNPEDAFTAQAYLISHYFNELISIRWDLENPILDQLARYIRLLIKNPRFTPDVFREILLDQAYHRLFFFRDLLFPKVFDVSSTNELLRKKLWGLCFNTFETTSLDPSTSFLESSVSFTEALTPQEFSAVLTALSRSAVACLVFTNNIIQPDLLTSILKALASNPNSRLQELCINNCSIADEGVQAIVEALPKMRKLKSLSLKSNGITGKGFQKIVSLLAISHLEFLDLSGNPMSSTESRMFANALKSNYRIKNFEYSSAGRDFSYRNIMSYTERNGYISQAVNSMSAVIKPRQVANLAQYLDLVRPHIADAEKDIRNVSFEDRVGHRADLRFLKTTPLYVQYSHAQKMILQISPNSSLSASPLPPSEPPPYYPLASPA